MQQNEILLYEKLYNLEKSNIYPYHMPGHKRNMKGYPLEDFYGIDITEIEGFDNLHEAEGILKEAMLRAGSFYGSGRTFFLVGGSSCGVLAAIMSTVKRRGKLLLCRNAHKSAYHGVMLGEIKAAYLYPKQIEEYGIAGGITPEDVKRGLEENPDCEAVFVTSPTYDGIISDIKGIVEVSHAYGIPVIVDEAHGAHLPLFSNCKSAVAEDADIIIQSLHKTLPSFTQTALLHKNGNIIQEERLEKYLCIFQTSSPSYILMAGMDECIRIMGEQGKALVKEFEANREIFLEKMKELRYIEILNDNLSEEMMEKYGIKALDRGKIIISVKNTLISGKELYEMLLKGYDLQVEMALNTYILAIMTIMDKKEGFLRLADALLQIDETLSLRKEHKDIVFPSKNEIRMTLWEAENAEWEYCSVESSNGKIAAEAVSLYPPGIPVILPGEVIGVKMAEKLLQSLQQGLTVQGLIIKKSVPYIRVLAL